MASSSFLDYAHRLAEEGELAAAEEALRVLLRMPGQHPDAALALAELLIAQGNPDEARVLLQSHATNRACGDRLRELHVGESEFDQARALIASRAKALSASGWLDKGLLRQLDGDLRGAIDACHAALAEEADDAYALNALGRAHFNAGDAALAKELFRRVTTIRPRFAEGWHNLGHVLRARNELEAAIDAYRQALLHAPAHRSSRRNLAVALMMARRTTEALPLLERLADEDPGDQDALVNHGICLQLLGRQAEAEDRLRGLMDRYPGNFPVMAQLGRLLYRSQRYAESCGLLEQALQLRPLESQLRQELAAVLVELGQLPRALSVIRDGLVLDAGNPELARMLEQLSVAGTNRRH